MRIFRVHIILVFIAAFSNAFPVEKGSKQVVTDQGIFTGELQPTRQNKSVLSFKGIRYALPPIGARRWQPPAPPERSNHEIKSSNFGPSCLHPDMDLSLKGTFFYHPNFQTSEDCLYLNIWAPFNDDLEPRDQKKIPVMVWIHGGAFVEGTSSMALYDGAEMASKGIVFVSINYRLGVLGFLAHPDLSRESTKGISGNYGTLDQIQALKWIQKNIESFGGDKDNVTILGESSGATSVSHLLATQTAKGLFHKAILQSLTLPPMAHLVNDNYGLISAQKQGVSLQRLLSDRSIGGMRDRLAEDVLQSYHSQKYVIDPGPIVDGIHFRSQIFETFENSLQAEVPIIIGYTSGEGNTYPQYGLAGTVPESPEEYEFEVEKRYGPLTDMYLSIYPSSDLDNAVVNPIRDATFGWAAQRIARDHSKLTPNTYLYFFDHEKGLGAFHTADLIYSFNNVSKNPKYSPNWPDLNPTRADYVMAELISDYWVDFAKTGNPNGKGRPEWRTYSESSRDYLLFRDGSGIPSKDLLPKAFALHEAIFQQRRKCGNQTWWFNNIGLLAPELGKSRCKFTGLNAKVAE